MDPYRYFRLEARDLLGAIDLQLRALKPLPYAMQSTQADRLIHVCHTLKGAAAVVGLRSIAADADQIQLTLKHLQLSIDALTEEQITQLKHVHARITDQVGTLNVPRHGGPT